MASGDSQGQNVNVNNRKADPIRGPFITSRGSFRNPLPAARGSCPHSTCMQTAETSCKVPGNTHLVAAPFRSATRFSLFELASITGTIYIDSFPPYLPNTRACVDRPTVSANVAMRQAAPAQVLRLSQARARGLGGNSGCPAPSAPHADKGLWNCPASWEVK